MTDLRLALFTDTYAPQINGVTRTLARLVSAVERRGGEAQVFTSTDPGAPLPGESTRRYRSIAVPFYRDLRLSMPGSARINRDVARFAPTLVHAATPFGLGIAARRAAAAVDLPFVTSYHTSFSEYARFYKLGLLAGAGWQFLRWFHNAGSRTYCPTMAVRRDLEARGFANLAVWGRGVDRTRFSPKRRSRAMRIRMGGADSIIVAYVGRVAREKGVDQLLTAMHSLSHVRALQFAFVGDGPHLDECRRVAPATATFLGRLDGDELAAAYASADILVFPSLTDTFGNVLLEAMASGVPILAADTPVTREVVGSAATCYAASDPSALCEALVALASNRDNARRLAQAGLVRSRLFQWDLVFDALIADYESVVRAHQRVTHVGPAVRPRSGRAVRIEASGAV